MTTLTMRSSEAVPASFVRPKLNQRHYNQAQPLWMRVLEEKYQKLQLKIAQSTATMNGLYSSAIGKTIYDTKLIRASLQKTKEPTAQNAQNVKRRNANFDIKTKITATRISSNPGVLKNSDNGVYRKNVFTNSDIKKDINDRYSSDDESVNKFDKDSKINDTGSTKVSEILCLRCDKNQSNKKEFSELISTKIKNKLSISQTLGKESNMQNADYASSRHSLSTQKTVQSCPANVTEQSTSVPKPRSKSRVESAGKSKINRRKMKMFSRMSAEAQTALTETIMEHISDENTDSEMEDCDNGNKKQVQIQDNGLSTGCVLSFEDINDINKRNNCSDSEVSFVSRDSRSAHTKLPVIPNENQEFLTLRHIQQVNCKVPGLRKLPFATKREPTFEITPPGFDIRYKDAPIREERESETPPPDIRDRAIRKCQDWLSRYTPRTQRASQTSN